MAENGAELRIFEAKWEERWKNHEEMHKDIHGFSKKITEAMFDPEKGLNKKLDNLADDVRENTKFRVGIENKRAARYVGMVSLSVGVLLIILKLFVFQS